MTGENGAGQVIEACLAVLAAIALPVRLGIIPAMTGHRSTAAGPNAVWPAMLPNKVKTLAIVDQR